MVDREGRFKTQPSEDGFERLNITVPKSTVEYFDYIAKRYFEGNRSQLIRSSVYFYSRFLETGTTLELDEIKRNLGKLNESIDKNRQEIKEILETQHGLTKYQKPDKILSASSRRPYEDAQVVRRAIQDSKDGEISEGGVIEQTGIQSHRVQSALEVLLDNSMIERRNRSGTNFYRIIG